MSRHHCSVVLEPNLTLPTEIIISNFFHRGSSSEQVWGERGFECQLQEWKRFWLHVSYFSTTISFLNGPSPASSSFIFGLCQQVIQFLQQINVKYVQYTVLTVGSGFPEGVLAVDLLTIFFWGVWSKNQFCTYLNKV